MCDMLEYLVVIFYIIHLIVALYRSDTDICTTSTNEKIGHIIGRETIDIEHKEFRPPYNIVLRLTCTNIMQRIINNNTWNELYEHMDICIKMYIDNFLAKYLVSFANTDIEYGYIYYGVSDAGEFIGIPISDNLQRCDYKLLKLWVRNIVINVIKRSNCQYMYHTITTHMKIDIIRLTYDPNILELNDDIDKTIINYVEQKKVYENKLSLYTQQKSAWLNELYRYRRSISTMINEADIKFELIKYINDNATNDNIRKNIILQLTQTNIVTFEENQITNERNDDMKISYWVTQFREYKSKYYKTTRPIWDNKMRPISPYVQLLSSMKPMMRRMIEYGVQFAVIRIRMPGRKILSSFPYLRYDGINTYISRIIDKNGEPTTVKM